MFTLPLQVFDDFMLQYHIGHVLVLLLVLGLLGTLPLRSKKITGLHLLLFGILFVATPLSLMDNIAAFRYVGVGLVFIGPMIVIAGR